MGSQIGRFHVGGSLHCPPKSYALWHSGVQEAILSPLECMLFIPGCFILFFISNPKWVFAWKYCTPARAVQLEWMFLTARYLSHSANHGMCTGLSGCHGEFWVGGHREVKKMGINRLLLLPLSHPFERGPTANHMFKEAHTRPSSITIHLKGWGVGKVVCAAGRG